MNLPLSETTISLLHLDSFIIFLRKFWSAKMLAFWNVLHEGKLLDFGPVFLNNEKDQIIKEVGWR